MFMYIRSPYHAPVAPPYGHHGHHKSKRDASAGPKYGYGYVKSLF